MNRFDLQQISDLRLADAQVLLKDSRYHGAYYMAGYAVECAIKACIARLTREFDFPDRETVKRSYTHKLEQLIEVAQLRQDLDSETAADLTFARFWGVVKDWNEDTRYELGTSELHARNMLEAVSDGQNGVLRWLKKRW